LHFSYRQGVAVEPQGAQPARKESGTPVPFVSMHPGFSCLRVIIGQLNGYYQGRREEVLQRVELGASTSFNINAGQLPERYR